MFQLDLMRHGATELSHTLRGSTDDALTAEGWQQMQDALDQALHAEPHWDAVFTSPLQRCRLFAESAAQRLGLDLMILPQLQEMHFGDWEAAAIQQLYERDPKALEQFWLQPTQFSPPNAESLQAFEQRVMAGAAQIQRSLSAQNSRKALVVTHGGVIKLLKCKALQQPLDDILKMTAELGQMHSFQVSKVERATEIVYLSEQNT